MAALGVRQLPLVTKGGRWVNGQSLKAVADLCGIQLGEVKHLLPVELVRKIFVLALEPVTRVRTGTSAL